jgi:pre-mRNA-splicing factor ATP-dependent RNA helicase DHX38/PRP16
MAQLQKRERPDNVAMPLTAAQRRDADDPFYGEDEDEKVHENSADAYTDAATLLAEIRRVRAAESTARAGKSGAAQARASETQRRDEAWMMQQMAAGGVRFDESDAGSVAGYQASVERQATVHLTVNRGLIPDFISGGGRGPVLFSKQQGLVIPLKDPKCDFAELAAKGSLTLRELRKKAMERKAMVDAIGGQGSSIDAAVRGGAGAMTQQEVDAMKRRLRAEQRRNASVEDKKAMDNEDQATARARLREDSSLAPPAATLDAERHEAIQKQRRTLPIYACRAELLRYIRENAVVVVAGETGSGKTTQMVQYLLEAGYARNGLIGCTQPRRMAAVGVSHRVAEEVGDGLGETVGYAIRLEDVTSPRTKVKFMTDGVLLRELVHDRLLNKYSVVVMDEAHERSVSTDVLLGAMKDILRQRLDFKLVVTSATMEIEKFANFFNGPTFTIPGRTYPIEMRYERSPVADYVEQAVLRVLEIHTREAAGDVLVFMTGEDDVEGTCTLIRERAADVDQATADSLLVLPCYSMLPSTQQRMILSPAPTGQRKCIVATNIAETSLTIDGIRYVIDAGYMKCKVFKPTINMNALTLFPVSRAQANQRAGRAGRTAEGVCFRLYTEFQYMNEIIEAPVPEIQRSSVDSIVLLLKSIGVRDLATFDFIDPPPHENLRSSMYRLWLIQALDDMGDITTDGRRLAEFPAEPPLGRALLAGCQLGCGDAVVSVAALMSADSRSVFSAPRGREEQALRAREKFFAPDSDHVTLLNVYEQFTASGCSKGWAEDHFLNYLALKRACDIRVQFVDRLTRDFRLKLGEFDGDTDAVREAFTHGFFPHAARRTSMTEYTTMLSGVPCELHPTSAVHSAGVAPDYVIYNDFIFTSKEYMSVVSGAKPEWLVKASRGLFTSGDNALMHFKATLVQQQRQAVGAQREQEPRTQPRAPAEPTDNAAAVDAGTAKARFVPRRKA